MPFWPDRFKIPTVRSGPAAPAFVPPYDAAGVTVLEGWSTSRRLFLDSGAYLMRLRADRTGSPEQDLGYDAAGNLTGAAAFLNGDSGYGRYLYGQKGVANFGQSSSSVQPQFNATGLEGRPTLLGDGVDDSMVATGLGARSTFWTLMVFKIAAGGGVISKLIWALEDYPTSAQYQLIETIGAGISINSSRGTTPSVEGLVADVPVALIYEAGSSGGVLRSGTGNSASVSGDHGRANETMRIFNRGDGVGAANIHIGEMLMGTGSLNDGQRAALFQAASDYWGTPTP